MPNKPEPVNFLNVPEAIAVLLKAGFTDAIIDEILNQYTGVYVTVDRVKKLRTLMSRRGECPRFERRRYTREAPALLRTHRSIRLYSNPALLYCRSVPEQDLRQINPTQIVLIHRMLKNDELDINNYYHIVMSLIRGESFFRHCQHCMTWSLMSLDSQIAADRCSHCQQLGILTAPTWYLNA